MNPTLRHNLALEAVNLRTRQRRLNRLGEEAEDDGHDDLADSLYDAAWRCDVAAHRIGTALRKDREAMPIASTVH